MTIPFYRPYIGQSEVEAVERVLKSGWLTQGPEVKAFEREAAEVLGAPEGHECVAVSSATAGLYLLLKAMKLDHGHLIEVPDLTFAATINAVIAAGATPKIVDVDEDGIIRPSGLYRAITVTFGGFMGGPNATETLLYDQAHSFQPGAYRPNSTWSFFPTKNITAGEGGLVGCDSERAAIIRQMRDHGRSGTYEVKYPGSLNFRMTDIQAAILRVQLKRLPRILELKSAIEAVYREELDGLVKLPPKGITHLFWIRHPFSLPIKVALADKGIETSNHYKPLSRFDCYKKYCSDNMETSQKIASETLSLPFWPGLSKDQAKYVADAVKEAI